MKLIQPNEIQIMTLINTGEEPKGFTFAEGAIPPKHVFLRSIDLYHRLIKQTWAFPYFVQNQNYIIGCCGFKSEPQNNKVEIGYNIAPNARGLGAATASVKELSKIAFSSNLVDTVYALILIENKASINVVIKNGFLYSKSLINEEGLELELWELNKANYLSADF